MRTLDTCVLSMRVIVDSWALDGLALMAAKKRLTNYGTLDLTENGGVCFIETNLEMSL